MSAVEGAELHSVVKLLFEITAHIILVEKHRYEYRDDQDQLGQVEPLQTEVKGRGDAMKQYEVEAEHVTDADRIDKCCEDNRCLVFDEI